MTEPVGLVFTSLDQLTTWLREHGYMKLDTVSVTLNRGLVLLASPSKQVEQWSLQRVAAGVEFTKLPEFEVEYER